MRYLNLNKKFSIVTCAFSLNCFQTLLSNIHILNSYYIWNSLMHHGLIKLWDAKKQLLMVPSLPSSRSCGSSLTDCGHHSWNLECASAAAFEWHELVLQSGNSCPESIPSVFWVCGWFAQHRPSSGPHLHWPLARLDSESLYARLMNYISPSPWRPNYYSQHALEFAY